VSQAEDRQLEPAANLRALENVSTSLQEALGAHRLWYAHNALLVSGARVAHEVVGLDHRCCPANHSGVASGPPVPATTGTGDHRRGGRGQL
jgi:hypothetical protein